ncbi:SIS domain-containing protein [Pseudonocardia endophytica]|uniref:Phosphoglucose isomerase-like protein n=1 Tax=Pseudonocardia endophytica TaxID=401976 RepID=A0A4R1HHZ8_PSEEN|nr:phosphoglucose isomerase-like protein [Pseudonocardia endophytica]
MVLDDTLLADPGELASRDTAGDLRAAATAGAQIRSTVFGAAEAGVGSLAGFRPRALVLLRRPGVSGAAADLIQALLGPRCPVPVVVADEVPGWIGPLDVVVGHSVLDTDAELATSVELAARRGAEVVLAAPESGPVAAAGAGRIRLVPPRVPVPAGLGFAHAITTMLSAVTALELLSPAPAEGFEALADAVDAEAERCQPNHEPFVNPAKSLALRLAEHTPLLWGTDPAAVAVARHGAVTLATQAGVVAHAADLAQAGTEGGLARAVDMAEREHDVFRDPFDDPDPGALPPRLLLIGTGEEDPQAVSRMRLGREWPGADVVHPVEEVPRGTRDAALLRSVLLAVRLDMAAIYLGLAQAGGA